LFAPKQFRDDFEIVLKAVSSDGYVLKIVSKHLQNNIEIVMMAVSTSPYALLSALSKFRDDVDVVTVAVRNFGQQQLQYASDELKNNKVLLIVAFHHDPHCDSLKIPPMYFNDKEFILELLTYNGYLLQQLKHYVDGDEMVTAAVTSVGTSIQFASDRLRSDKSIVMAAVSNDRLSYVYLTRKLQNDADIIEAIVLNLNYIPEDIFRNL